MRVDVIVLGAGMVGVSVALHLQQRGRDVVLIDRQGAGEETSYGNAGLIQSEAVIPYTFPREFGAILSYAMNNRRDAVYHLSALPRLAPWLFRYWQNATPERIDQSARALAPLMAQCVAEHDALIAEAGDAARVLVQHQGWIRCLRTEESLRRAIADARRLDQYGVDYAILTGAQLRELEPHVSEKITGAPLPRVAVIVRSRHVDQSLCRSVPAQGRAFRDDRCARPRRGSIRLEPAL
jgi:D-amino-acid dehydrogenase